VASFLLELISRIDVPASVRVLISFREWLHSYQIKIAPLNMGAVEKEEFSSLSESGFIPTK